MTDERRSRLGVDGLGADVVESVDPESAEEVAVVEDLVGGGSGGSAPTGVGDGFPLDVDGVAFDGAASLEDGPGDDPLHDDVVGVGTRGDGEPAAVVGAHGIDTVYDVGPEDSVLGEFGSGEAGGGDDEQGNHAQSSAHAAESTSGIPRIAKAGLAFFGLILVAVLAFAIFEPIQVLPRIRLGPGFSFTDQAGNAFSSDDGRGVVTLYNFAPTNCGEECGVMFETMQEVGRRVVQEVDLGDVDFRMVTVALDTDDPVELAEAASGTGADGEYWRWAGTGPAHLRDVVGNGFRVYYNADDPSLVDFDQTFVIVDGAGLIRGEYAYATLASDADRLTRHIGLLGEEIRNAEGNTALLYEAAHVFLCYP